MNLRFMLDDSGTAFFKGWKSYAWLTHIFVSILFVPVSIYLIPWLAGWVFFNTGAFSPEASSTLRQVFQVAIILAQFIGAVTGICFIPFTYILYRKKAKEYFYFMIRENSVFASNAFNEKDPYNGDWNQVTDQTTIRAMKAKLGKIAPEALLLMD